MFDSTTVSKIQSDIISAYEEYAEMLHSKGAIVTGFDISPKMIDLAIKRNNGEGSFFVHNLTESLDMLETNSFDIVLCALALHYVPDWTPTIKEFEQLDPRHFKELNEFTGFLCIRAVKRSS